MQDDLLDTSSFSLRPATILRYSPECVEEEFSELRVDGLLRSSYGQRALPAHGLSAHAACTLVRAARTSYPRGHRGGTEDVEVRDTSHLTSFSMDGEHHSTPSESHENGFSEPTLPLLVRHVL
jgi:hypothetical protein